MEKHWLIWWFTTITSVILIVNAAVPPQQLGSKFFSVQEKPIWKFDRRNVYIIGTCKNKQKNRGENLFFP